MRNPVEFIRVKSKRTIRTAAIFRRMPIVIGIPVALVATGAVWAVFRVMASPKFFPFFAVLVFMVLLFLHFIRRDARFAAVAGYNSREVFLCEYGLAMFPFFIAGCLAGRFPASLVFMAFPAVALLPAGKKTLSITMFPRLGRILRSWEWTAGLRRNWYWILPFVILSCLLCKVPYASYFILLFILLMASELYSECEPLSYLFAAEKTASAYMRERTLLSLRDFALLTILPALLPIMFNPGFWWLVPAFYLFSAGVLAYHIFMKYSSYEPGSREVGAMSAGSIGLIGIILPFLSPVTLLLGIRYFYSARERLNYYLDDLD